MQCYGAALPVQIAKRQAVVNPENTFFSVKRFVGRRMNEVTEECKQVPYVVSTQDVQYSNSSRALLPCMDMHAASAALNSSSSVLQ